MSVQYQQYEYYKGVELEKVYDGFLVAQRYLISIILYQDKCKEDFEKGIIDSEEFNRKYVPSVYGKSKKYIVEFCKEKKIPIVKIYDDKNLMKVDRQYYIDKIWEIKKSLKKDKKRIRECSQYSIHEAIFMYKYYKNKFDSEYYKDYHIQLKEMPMSKYCFANITSLHNYETKTGVSKNPEYLQIEGVPCIVNEYNSETNMITLNSFASAINRNFKISRKEFDINFTEINPDNDGYLHLVAYPIPIHISEFKIREDVAKLEKKIKRIIANEKVDKRVRKILSDKLFQLIASQGAPYITIKDYYKYKKGEIDISTHKRFGNEIFNRNCRWCPPIDITYEEFKASKSYPAPLGIRPKDFCLPSELIMTFEELINQISNFDGIDDISFEEMRKILTFIEKKEHFCKYCGEKINIEKYYSEYKSSDNYIEICHRSPKDRFLHRNIYWGHGDCNRRQGGYTETDRMNDGVRLMWINGIINRETYEKLYSVTVHY